MKGDNKGKGKRMGFVIVFNYSLACVLRKVGQKCVLSRASLMACHWLVYVLDMKLLLLNTFPLTPMEQVAPSSRLQTTKTV